MKSHTARRDLAKTRVLDKSNSTERHEKRDPNFNPHKRSIKSNLVRYKTFYLMLLPAIIYFLIFSYWPMTGIIQAFRDFSFRSGMYGTGWVGLKYFRDFFTHRNAWIFTRNTLIISFIKLFLYLPFPIILALMFNEVKNDRLRGAYQSISYLPYFISWVVVIGIYSRLFAPNTGMINELLAWLGLTDGSTFWMMENSFSTHLSFQLTYGKISVGIPLSTMQPLWVFRQLYTKLHQSMEQDGASKFGM